MTTSILLKTPKLINFSLDSPWQEGWEPVPSLKNCTLKWRQKKLWLKRVDSGISTNLPALESKEWLLECLQRSPVQLVCIDPKLEETQIQFWADVCKQTKKQASLRILGKLEQQNTFCWGIKRSFDWLAAALLLLVLSPLFLVLMLLIRVTSPGPIFFRQWRIGYRGQLFEMLKFRSMAAGAEKMHHQVMGEQAGLHKCHNDDRVTPLGAWMRKFSLDELPQLINVLRSEMSLVGPRPWALYDGIRIKRPWRKRLKAMPGITGAWQVSERSNLLDLEKVSQIDLNYLRNWSLWKDFQILILTIPRVISGRGAC